MAGLERKVILLFSELPIGGETYLKAREDNLFFGLWTLKGGLFPLCPHIQGDWPGYFLGNDQFLKGEIHI